MRRFFLAVLVLITFTFPAVAQTKHPFTFEDMMKLKRVGEPEVSPDGKWVIFSVVDVDVEANTKTPHIWIVPTAGGQEKEIIADQDADRPRWAPDGKRFAFLSTKTGGSQIWSADFDGNAGTVTWVHKLTSIATEAGGELWSPDGKTILFTSDVYPECDDAPKEELECNAKKVDEAAKSKVKALTFDHLLYRHWNAYKEGKRTHIFALNSNFQIHIVVGKPEEIITARPVDLTPGDYDAPVFSLGGQDNYAFSPDGQEICYTSNHGKNPAASTNNDLWIVPVNFPEEVTPAQVLAKTKNITADNPASDSTPLYSPDGRYIAYRAQQRPGYESDRFRLMLYDRKTGEKKSLTENFDRWVGTYTWAPDSSRLYFVAEDYAEATIFAVTAGTRSTMEGKLEKLVELSPPVHALGDPAILRHGFEDDLALSPNGDTIYFTAMTINSPVEIYRAPSKCQRPAELTVSAEGSKPEGVSAIAPRCSQSINPQEVTDINGAMLSQIAMSPLEPFWFTGAHDDKVEGFLVKPPNFNASKKYPVKFLIHGGPQGAWGDDWSFRWNAELFAAPTSGQSSGYVVIMINFHGSTGYGQKFIDAINGDWGGAPFEDLMKGLDYAEKTYPFIDKNRECALGASYGGYMANWILGHTDRFKCIVTHDGMFNAESAWGTTEELWFNNWEFKGTPYDNRASYEKWSPHQYAKNFKTPTLVIHGQRDYRLDVSEGLQLFTTLQMEGVPSKMLYFPDEGHWVGKPQNSQLWYKTVNDWVDRWTK
jgi:dipeptidyl aminopeptidase/acylaminoacyl peptidase